MAQAKLVEEFVTRGTNSGASTTRQPPNHPITKRLVHVFWSICNPKVPNSHRQCTISHPDTFLPRSSATFLVWLGVPRGSTDVAKALLLSGPAPNSPKCPFAPQPFPVCTSIIIWPSVANPHVAKTSKEHPTVCFNMYSLEYVFASFGIYSGVRSTPPDLHFNLVEKQSRPSPR